MTRAQRLEGVIINGVQRGPHPGEAFVLATDPLTQTSFAVEPGETLGQALDRLDARWAEAERETSADGRVARLGAPGGPGPERAIEQNREAA
jgi:hypothetical protein